MDQNISICDVGCMGSIQDFIETNVMWYLSNLSQFILTFKC